MKNIGIALHAGTPEQRNLITNYFSSEKLKFWHWVDDFWIVQVSNETTLKTFYEQITAVPDFKTPTILMFEFDNPIKYYGRANKDAWDWLKENGNVSK